MTILEANRIVALGLVVLIWLVQLIIYPAFASIDRKRFAAWHSGYTRSITFVVAPLMFGQTSLVGLLVYRSPGLWAILAASMVAVAWAVTIGISVPCHDRLQSGGFDDAVLSRLISTNWFRTAAWSAAFFFLLLAR